MWGVLGGRVVRRRRRASATPAARRARALADLRRGGGGVRRAGGGRGRRADHAPAPVGTGPLRRHRCCRSAGADQRVLDRPLLPAPRLHERHGVGEEDQLRRTTCSAATTPRPAARATGRGIECLLVLGRASARCWPSSTAGAAGVFWLAMARRRRRRASCYMPQGRLWNARLLPFYYLAALPARRRRRGRAGPHDRRASFAADIRPTRAARALASPPSPVLVGVLAGRARPCPLHTPARRAVRLGGVGSGTVGPAAHEGQRASSTRWAKLELHRLRGQARLPRVLRHHPDHGRARARPTAAVGPCGSTRSSTTATARRWR